MKKKIIAIGVLAVFYLMISTNIIAVSHQANQAIDNNEQTKEECSLCASNKDDNGRQICNLLHRRVDSLDRKVARYMRNPARIFLGQIIFIQNFIITVVAFVARCSDVIDRLYRDNTEFSNLNEGILMRVI